MEPRCEVFRWKKEITFGFFFFNIATSHALGLKTSTYCIADYLNFCSQFEIGSEDLKKCFRDHGEDLSKPCVQALIDDGEITQEEVDQRKQERIQKKESIVVKVKNKLKSFFQKKPKIITKSSPEIKKEEYPEFLEWYAYPEQTENNSLTPYGIMDKFHAKK